MKIIDILAYTLRLDTKEFNASAGKADAQVNKLATSISKNLQGAVAGMITGMLGLYGLKKAFDWTIVGAAEEEAALKRLEIAINNTGIAFANVSSEIRGVTEGLRATTAFSDDEMFPALQALVEMTGNYEESLKLLPYALDLAAAKEMSVTEAAKLLAKASEENLGRLGMLFPSIM